MTTSVLFLRDIFSYISEIMPHKLEWLIQEMHKEQFIIRSGSSFEDSVIEKKLSITSFHDGEIVFRLNLNPDRMHGINSEAKEVLKILYEAINSNLFKENYTHKFILESGDLILFNNWQVMYSRDSFKIDYSHWRWLQRCYFSSDNLEI